MEGISKSHIDAAFHQSLMSICNIYGVKASDITISARFSDKGKMLLHLCRKGRMAAQIGTMLFSTLKMIGLRFEPLHVERIFKTVHNAFMMETATNEPERISLVFYESQKAGCPCIGVLKDEKPLKVMMLSDIVRAIDLESEQLN